MSAVYGVAMGVKRGRCQEENCTNCPRYEAADDVGEGGGPCSNCGHFPALHENLGPDETEPGAEEEKIFYDDPDPLGLLKEPGNAETAEEIEARKQLQDLCEWSIAGNEIRFLERLGSGRSAKVYKGLYKDQIVAIKVLKPILDRKELHNFKCELDIMSSVKSSHVVHFFGGCLQPKICLVMEYCSNGSLYHLFQRKELNFDWSLFFRLTVETVEGVLALHNHTPTIVHRDLKSLNLLVNSEYSVKVCDFGLSRVVQGSQDESTLGKLRGTYAYSAPEVYKGEKYSGKADVFSLGIILWEGVARVFTGEYQRPYKEFNYRIDFQIIIQSAKHGVRPKLGLDMTPESLRNLITRCWSASPHDRPETAEVLAALQEIKKEYEASPAEWDAKVGTLTVPDGKEKPKTPASSGSPVVVSSAQHPKPAAPATTNATPPASPAEAPATKWEHKTLEELFPEEAEVPLRPNPSQGNKEERKSKKLSLTRSSSKKIAQELQKEDGKIEIEVTGSWKSTVDWRDEDAFDDEKKKGKLTGLKNRIFGGRKKKP